MEFDAYPNSVSLKKTTFEKSSYHWSHFSRAKYYGSRKPNDAVDGTVIRRKLSDYLC